MKNFNKTSIISISAVLSLFLILPGVTLAAGPASVNLGAAGNFEVLAKTGISTTGTTVIFGNIGISPAAATYVTGFSLSLPAAGAFSTSPLVGGKIYASDYADPTPANMTAAISDMQTAYTDAAGRPADITELGAGSIGGRTLAPGVYKWGTGVTIPTDVTLSGGANDVWIFQVAQNLDISSATKIILAGGAQANNIFWVVAGQATLGTSAVFNGNILDQTSIVLNTGAVLNGRALAQAAVTLDADTLTFPTYSASPSVPTFIPVPAIVVTPPPSPVQVSVTPSSEPNVALQARLNELLGTLHLLQAQANQRGFSASAGSFGQQVKAIVANLSKGNSGSDVRTLQQFLIDQNKGPAAQALASAAFSTRFGNFTRAALAEFQASVGIVPASGNFGAITRAYINAHF